MTHIMAKIRFTEPTLIALTGHHFEACTENMKIKPYKLYLVEKGEVLSFKETSTTSRVYLAIGGGFKLDSWLNSTSTDLNIGVGGFQGEQFKKAMKLK